MATRKALVVGATGLIGGGCVQALLENDNYCEVIVVVRRPLAFFHSKLTTVVTPLEDLQADLADIEVDDVFCCLGTTIKKAGSQEAFKAVDYTLVVDIARIMKKRGAQQFVVISSIGADENSKVFYSKTKGQMEKALVSMKYLHLHIVRPSLLLGSRQEFRFGEHLAGFISPVIKPLLRGRLKKYRPIKAQTVASFMAGLAVKEPLKTINIYESNDIVDP